MICSYMHICWIRFAAFKCEGQGVLKPLGHPGASSGVELNVGRAITYDSI